MYTSHPKDSLELFATTACDGQLKLWDVRLGRWVACAARACPRVTKLCCYAQLLCVCTVCGLLVRVRWGCCPDVSHYAYLRHVRPVTAAACVR